MCCVLCSVLLCSVLFLHCCVVFCSVLFCSVLFCSVLFCSYTVLFCSATGAHRGIWASNIRPSHGTVRTYTRTRGPVLTGMHFVPLGVLALLWTSAWTRTGSLLSSPLLLTPPPLFPISSFSSRLLIPYLSCLLSSHLFAPFPPTFFSHFHFYPFFFFAFLILFLFYNSHFYHTPFAYDTQFCFYTSISTPPIKPIVVMTHWFRPHFITSGPLCCLYLLYWLHYGWNIKFEHFMILGGN